PCDLAADGPADAPVADRCAVRIEPAPGGVQRGHPRSDPLLLCAVRRGRCAGGGAGIPARAPRTVEAAVLAAASAFYLSSADLCRRHPCRAGRAARAARRLGQAGTEGDGLIRTALAWTPPNRPELVADQYHHVSAFLVRNDR